MTMRLRPHGLLGRLAAAFALAIAAIVGLDAWLRDQEARARGGSLRTGEAARTGDAVARAEGGLPVEPRSGAPDLGVAARTVLLCRPGAAPPDTAPVLRVARDGGLRVVRAAPLPAQPGRQAIARAAVELPAEGLGALDPVQRATLLDAFAAVAPDGLGPDQVQGLDVEVAAADLETLLSWFR